MADQGSAHHRLLAQALKHAASIQPLTTRDDDLRPGARGRGKCVARACGRWVKAQVSCSWWASCKTNLLDTGQEITSADVIFQAAVRDRSCKTCRLRVGSATACVPIVAAGGEWLERGLCC